MGNRPEVGVVILNWNGKEDTCACLSSLEKCTGVPFEMVVVDNGSSDGSVSHIKQQFPDVTLLETGENLGYAGGNNVGLRYCLHQGFPIIVVLNNDTKVDPNFLSAFVDGFGKLPYAGILGGKIMLMDEPERFDHFGGNWRKEKIDFDYVGFRQVDDQKNWTEPFTIDYVCGVAIAFRRRVLEDVGLFDERFFLFAEEADLCFRARQINYRVYTWPSALVWHKVSASFSGGKPHTTYFQWRNKLLWLERNFHGLERLGYFVRLLGVQIPLLCQLITLRAIQTLLQKVFRPNQPSLRNNERLQRYRASLYGIQDYFLRRFGAGRSHLFLRRD